MHRREFSTSRRRYVASQRVAGPITSYSNIGIHEACTFYIRVNAQQSHVMVQYKHTSPLPILYGGMIHDSLEEIPNLCCIDLWPNREVNLWCETGRAMLMEAR